MRVIIAGGTGFIGRLLTKKLVADNHQIFILSRSPGRDRPLPPNVKLVGWDARTANGWGELVNESEVIVNLAGENIGGDGFLPDRWTPAKKAKIINSRLDAGRAIVEAVTAAKRKPRLFIQASAIGYYGVHGDEWLDESSPAGTDYLAQTCVQWEDSTAPVETMGVRRLVTRIGVVFSRKEGALPRLLVPYRLFGGGPFGSGRQWWSWIHPNDVAGSLYYLMQQPTAAGPINLTAPNPLTNREVGKTLGHVLRRPSWLPVPAFAMRLLVGEVATIVLDGQRVMPKQLQNLGYKFQFPTLEPALQAELQ